MGMRKKQCTGDSFDKGARGPIEKAKKNKKRQNISVVKKLLYSES